VTLAAREREGESERGTRARGNNSCDVHSDQNRGFEIVPPLTMSSTCSRKTKSDNSKANSNMVDPMVEELNQLLRPFANDAVAEDAKAAFEQHVGPYPTVLDAAASHVIGIFAWSTFFFKFGYDRSFDRYGDPFFQHIRRPKLDLRVWMGLFLGREREDENRQCFEDGREQGNVCFEDIHKAFCSHGEIRNFPVAELTRSILQGRGTFWMESMGQFQTI